MKKFSAYSLSVLSLAGLVALVALILATESSVLTVLFAAAAVVLSVAYAQFMAKSFEGDPYIYFKDVDLSHREVVMA